MDKNISIEDLQYAPKDMPSNKPQAVMDYLQSSIRSSGTKLKIYFMKP